MAKTTISVPEGHHVEVHAPMAPQPGATGHSFPAAAGVVAPVSSQPGQIPDATAEGMKGALDQALATAPKEKSSTAAPKKAAPKKAEPKKKHKKKPAPKASAADADAAEEVNEEAAENE